MKWQVVARPQAENDLIETAHWYDNQREGLGDEFIEEVIAVFDALEINPFAALPAASNQKYSLAVSKTISLSRSL